MRPKSKRGSITQGRHVKQLSQPQAFQQQSYGAWLGSKSAKFVNLYKKVMELHGNLNLQIFLNF